MGAGGEPRVTTQVNLTHVAEPTVGPQSSDDTGGYDLGVLELEALRGWTSTRWAVAVAAAVVSAVAIGVPTDVIPNPVFGRQGTPVEPWAVPVLVVTAVLSGLLVATYVRPGSTVPSGQDEALDRPGRFGGAAGLLSFFAVGCPICNKLVVIALGTSGALTWFAPLQPYLGLAALGLLVWALRVRLRGEVACPVDVAEPAGDPVR